MTTTRLRQYTLSGEFRPTGAGMCEWTFGTDDLGKEIFLKRYLKPKYPVPGFPGSKEMKKKLLDRCHLFEKRQQSLMMLLRKSVRDTGNLVTPVDFFREGTFYYKVAPKIDAHGITVSEMHRLDQDDIYVIMLTALQSVGVLHNLNVVHGDLKPDNILIKKTEKSYASKLIDFDDSYPSADPPPAEIIVGDQVYFSPEAERYIKGKCEKGKAELTGQADMFALGVVFHQYWSGSLPNFDRSRFRSVASAVEGGAPIELASRIPEAARGLIKEMLARDPKGRPIPLVAIQRIKDARKRVSRPVSDLPARPTGGKPGAPTPGGGLRGRLLGGRPVGERPPVPPKGGGPPRPAAGPSEPPAPSSQLKGKVLSKLMREPR